MATKTRQVVLLVGMVCGALGLLTFLLIVPRPPSQHLSLRETLVGHTNGVFCLAYSPDGKTLASGGYDQTVRIWKIGSGKESVALGLGPSDHMIWSVAFSTDGKSLATAGSNVQLWDLSTKAIIFSKRVPGERDFWSVAFSPDGRTLASGSGDNSIRLWDVTTGENTATLPGHTPMSLAFTRDGKILASGGNDKTIRLWDTVTNENIATLQGHESSVNSVAFSQDGRTLASGSDDKTVRLWDAIQHTNTATLKGHAASVRSVDFTPDGKTLASGDYDGIIKLWHVRTTKNTTTIQAHANLIFQGKKGEKDFLEIRGSVWGLSFSPDKTLASASGDYTIKLWDLITEE
jgi:WD40 repeat protein